MIRLAAAALLLAGIAAPVAVVLPWWDVATGSRADGSTWTISATLAEVAGTRAAVLVAVGAIAALAAVAALVRRAGRLVVALAAALLAGTAAASTLDGGWPDELAGSGRSLLLGASVLAACAAVAAVLAAGRRLTTLAAVAAVLVISGALVAAPFDHPEIQVIR